MPLTSKLRRLVSNPGQTGSPLVQRWVLIGRLVVVTILLSLVFLPVLTCAEDKRFSDAPEFPTGLPWLNVEEPLSLRQLRGKVVVLDFWTYGCINCLHVADELKELEKQFGNALVVVGVHSPKFDNERDLSTLERNILRYELRHPVVQDEDFQLMDAYGARAWPTLSVIDPKGQYVARLVGEDVQERLTRIVDFLLTKYSSEIDTSPLPLAILQHKAAAKGLAGPGKVAVNDHVVAISDTLRHRVVIADRSGKVLSVFGGTAGFSDGKGSVARFRSPQGVLVDDGRVYVADAGNHAVRMIDLGTERVTTLAGTGKVGHRLRDTVEGTARTMDLRSPWALAIDGADLYVAMAGSHQIWRLDLMRDTLSAFAGSGREGIEDGSLRQATFSQPSGLVLVGRNLYVADPEASAIRRIDIDNGRVETLVGTGLFDFGDRDGDFREAQLQHPGGIAALGPDSLLVADSYNHKLRKLDLATRRVETFAEAGLSATANSSGGDVTLNEPSGLAVSGDFVLIADTNNDRLLTYDPDNKTLAEWPLDWGAVSLPQMTPKAQYP